MPATKKYTLFSSPKDGSKPVCAFFLSPDGCRNGANCKFSHSKAGSTPKAPISVKVEELETSSVVSSESEDEVSSPQVTSDTNKKSKTNTPKNNGNQDDDPFAPMSSPPAAKMIATPKNNSNNKNKRKENPNNDMFANPKKKSGPLPGSQKSPAPEKNNNKNNKSKSPARTPTAKGATPTSSKSNDFRSMISSLPVANFSIPEGTKKSNKKAKTEDADPMSSGTTSSAPTNDDGMPLPKSTPAGRKYLKAVKATREHERFSTAYDFAKWKTLDEEAGLTDWIKAKPFGSWCASNPQVIAIDCEMCETQDPLSGVKNAKALCRVSIVNAENPEEVLLDTLVKPLWPVTDYRARINGISKEHLDSVEFTRRHAQAFLMALCSEETVIVGHAVENDLVALHMEHTCVVDSSLIFKAKDNPTSSVSLRDLVMGIQKVEMPDVHDSVNDARKALECVDHYVENDGMVEPVDRTPRNKGHQLFIHRIPKQCTTSHLSNMFLNITCIKPTGVDDVEFSGDTGKTHVTFRSPRHATLAFDTLEGAAEDDKSGRLQKKVYLRNGNYVRVRKMVFQNRINNNSSSGSSNGSNTPNNK